MRMQAIKFGSKMNYYKVISVMISVLMAVNILTGCAKGRETTATGTAAKTSTAATAAKTTAKTTAKTSATNTAGTQSVGKTDAEATAEGPGAGDGTGADATETDTGEDLTNPDISEIKTYDLKGRVLKLVTHSQTVLPYYDMNARGCQVLSKLLEEAELKYNCKFEFEVVASETITKTNLESSVLAGVYYADAVRLTRPNAFPKYEKENILLSLNDYIDFSQPVYKQYDQINGVVYPDKVYAFFFVTFLSPMPIFYNKDILSKEGVPDLHVYA